MLDTIPLKKVKRVMTENETNPSQTIEQFTEIIQKYFQSKQKWSDVITFLIKKNNTYHLSISKMYNYVDINFEDLEFLSKLFNTKIINFAHGVSWEGCETCNHGSNYELNITIEIKK